LAAAQKTDSRKIKFSEASDGCHHPTLLSSQLESGNSKSRKYFKAELIYKNRYQEKTIPVVFPLSWYQDKE